MKQATRVENFTEFARTAEPRLRHALVAALGADHGRDAVSEALMWAWENWGKVQQLDNPIGYLYRLGQRRTFKTLRRQPRLPEVPTGEFPWIEPELPAALKQLTQSQRTAVLLIHGYGWTYREVAELLDVGLSTVQTHAERGLEKLRSQLEVEDA